MEKQLAVSAGLRICRECNKTFPLNAFYSFLVHGVKRYSSYCIECMHSSPEFRKRAALRTAKCTAKKVAQGFCRWCHTKLQDNGLQSCASCRSARATQAAIELRALRKIVLDHYGHLCPCCPEGTFHPDEFLTVEHVGGWGKNHRSSTGLHRISGSQLYRWIVRSGFPSDIAILCWNCNCSKNYSGYCPHEVERATQGQIYQEAQNVKST